MARTAGRIGPLRRALAAHMERKIRSRADRPVTRHPEAVEQDDEPFLAVAAATGSVLVTGNLEHLPRRARAGGSVLTPRQLVDKLR